jgi:hypothetical protein
VGIVVPTLGTRPSYLQECLNSIRSAGDAHVVLVAPKTLDPKPFLETGLIDDFVEDPNNGLAAAINSGFEKMPSFIEFMNWLGDDDLLYADAISKTEKALESNPSASIVFGQCDYIDSEGRLIWTNKSGSWAGPLLRFGPDLIPQPGALFRRSTFYLAGALDIQLSWAFDFDLFIKLSKLGTLIYLKTRLAKFRWHPESLSVGQRRQSVSEASKVRVSHLPRLLRRVSILWETAVKVATLLAGDSLGKKARKRAAGN